MGFTQRQAGGKFSRDEADGFIEQLQNEAEQQSADAPAVEATAPVVRPAPKARTTAASTALAKIPTPQLAAELQRRGWIVVEP